MDGLYFLGQVICLGALGYGAYLCLRNAGLGNAESASRELPPDKGTPARLTQQDLHADSRIVRLPG
jgi:hypothetical protein